MSPRIPHNPSQSSFRKPSRTLWLPNTTHYPSPDPYCWGHQPLSKQNPAMNPPKQNVTAYLEKQLAPHD